MQQLKRIRRPITGVLLLDKPLGFSSNGVLQKVKWLYQAEKAGHTGNLDPLATGLLPVCLGEATKFSQALLDADKAYIATIKLGQTTTTGDAEGDLLEQRSVQYTVEQLNLVLQCLIGPIKQVPPMYSALKHQGRALYEYARQGLEIERKSRDVTVYSIQLLEVGHDVIKIDVSCSKGTYIRVLAEDIGRKLGCGAHLIGLHRTRTAGFHVHDAVTVEALEAMGMAERDALLMAADCLLSTLPSVEISSDSSYAFTHGQSVRHKVNMCAGEVRVYDPLGGFLGLGEMTSDAKIAPKRVLRIDR
ncbi:tRNA pseudouridine(55) synthase TruB [Chitinivorax sp. B]|uniref:tRNA pseudouridine(55) synthase TruB n=1 Tax=Chitinivorax sp. B TaxID=2502235 RepID=UPI0010F4ADB0|nr:tRNA pseudouridine(55) synthase TruB [Chitinivorax sp. B]